MAEDKTTAEQQPVTDELAETPRENGDRSEGRQKTLARRATRTLSRARHAYRNEDLDEAAFLLREANILALMDLAEALRETQRSGEGISSD